MIRRRQVTVCWYMFIWSNADMLQYVGICLYGPMQTCYSMQLYVYMVQCRHVTACCYIFYMVQCKHVTVCCCLYGPMQTLQNVGICLNDPTQTCYRILVCLHDLWYSDGVNEANKFLSH